MKIWNLCFFSLSFKKQDGDFAVYGMGEEFTEKFMDYLVYEKAKLLHHDEEYKKINM